MKSSSFILLCVAGAAMFGCDDDDSTIAPAKLRVEAMSYGDIHYRFLKYDEQNRVSDLVSGTIDETGDSIESVYHVTYQGDVIEKIATDGDTHVFRYTYEQGRIIESREWVDDALMVVNEFYYNGSGQVDVWVTRQAVGGELVPLSRKAYRYDDAGNAVSMELENYDPITKGHALVSTSEFLDFDDKKNTSALFLNHQHPYHVQFTNNARTWRVTNTNGSVGETRYAYSYNAEGYATSQRDLGGELEISYRFVSY